MADEEEDEKGYSPDDFECPFCLELAYKPLVMPCGHLGCFWCVHSGMNCLDYSTCAVCRSQFNTCPSLAKSLHLFLKTVFPTKYSEREKIVSADEKEQGSSSPDLPLELKEKSLLDLLRCEACSKVPSDCVFSTCGHLLCGSCCYNSAVCPVDTCKQKIVYVPKPCLPLRNFIHKHFHDKIEETEESNPTYSPGSVLDESFTYSGSGVTVQTEETSNLIQKAKIDEEHFVHYGVGCDNCGMFPLRGPRFTCLDCPEAIGYDLCGMCYDSEAGAKGKFNQKHTKEHKMEKTSFRVTPLHIFTAAHPELTPAQILAILNET